MEQPRGQPIRKGPLQRTTRPPPPPPPPDGIFGTDRETPLPPGHTRVPSGRDDRQRFVRTRLNTKTNRRVARFFFFVFSPLGILGGFCAFVEGGGGSSDAPPSAVQPGTPPSGSVELVRSIVYIAAWDCDGGGSGTIVGDGSLVLTNAHVVESQPGHPCEEIEVWFTTSEDDEVYTFDPDAVAEVVAIDSVLDLAVLELLDPQTNTVLNAGVLGHPPIPLANDKLILEDEIRIYGYPAMGGLTITVTNGIYSGLATQWDYDYYKTDATVNHGNSGGAAFTHDGLFIGVPTALTLANLECDVAEECLTGDIPYGLLRPIEFARPLIAEATRAAK